MDEDACPTEDTAPAASVLNQPIADAGVVNLELHVENRIDDAVLSTEWMNKPDTFEGCPPGLEYLKFLDKLFIKTGVDIIEPFKDKEIHKRYAIKNSNDQQVFFAAEQTDRRKIFYFGNARSFEVHMVDRSYQEVLVIRREFKCWAGCCWCASVNCCAHAVSVEAPPGVVLGHVQEVQSGWAPKFQVQDPNGTYLLTIQGPNCNFQTECTVGDVSFVLFVEEQRGKTGLGQIKKRWTGTVSGVPLCQNRFEVTFPIEIDVKHKALVLGATMLINVLYFDIVK